MADPMIFDDGGSTRIKRLVPGGFGAMDGLLDVDDTVSPPQSTATVNGAFSNVKIVTIDGSGVPTTQRDSPINPTDNFTLTSVNGQTVIGTINAAGGLVIIIRGTPGNPPLVEAKQLKKKRRYVVINAGSIVSITGSINGDTVSIPTAGNLYNTLVLT